MTSEERMVIFASSLGTVFEWYDFYIYGTLAPILAAQFFSGVNPTAAFIFTLLAFAAGFGFGRSVEDEEDEAPAKKPRRKKAEAKKKEGEEETEEEPADEIPLADGSDSMFFHTVGEVSMDGGKTWNKEHDVVCKK